MNTVLWEALTVNARGQTELSRSANGVDNRASFEPQSGRLHQLSAGKAGGSDVINHRYGWDSTNQLTRRVDAAFVIPVTAAAALKCKTPLPTTPLGG